MYIVIKKVIYLVYMDEGEYWVRIRHQHYYGRLSASISVDCMCELLIHCGKIKLDGEKSDAKTLAFDSSGHLYSENHEIDTFLTDWRWVQMLLNLLLSTPKKGSYRTRSQTSINNEIIRISDRYGIDLKSTFIS